jgi:hypothetical protein
MNHADIMLHGYWSSTGLVLCSHCAPDPQAAYAEHRRWARRGWVMDESFLSAVEKLLPSAGTALGATG